MRSRVIYTFFVAVFLCSSCIYEEMPQKSYSNEPSDLDGVNLTCVIDLDQLKSELLTRAATITYPLDTYEEYVINANIKDINSLAFFIIKNDGKDFPMVAYRIIAPDFEGDGQYYLHRNPVSSERSFVLGGKRRTIDPEDDYYTSDINYNGESYFDDQHYGCWDNGVFDASNCVGYNGFAKMRRASDGSGELVVDVNDLSGTSAYDSDGKYDEGFTTIYGLECNEGGPYIASEAIILTFNYNNPMHGYVERLTRGDYYLMAIANFRESVSTVALYNENDEFNDSEDSNIGKIIHGLLDPVSGVWNPDTGIPRSVYMPFLRSAVSLKEITINAEGTLSSAESSYIRSNRARIVSTNVLGTSLVPGNNTYSYGLERTVSRVTFNVTNKSPETLEISDFSFSPHFAQAATFLWPNHDLDIRNYETYMTYWQGSPDFLGTDDAAEHKAMFRPYNTSGGSYRITERDVPKPLFDALLYEGGTLKESTGNLIPLSYSMTLSYGEKLVTENHLSTVMGYTAFKEVIDALNEDESIKVVFDVAESGRGGKIVEAGTDAIAMISSTFSNISEVSSDVIVDNEAGRKFVWEIIKTGGNGVKIKSESTGKYIRVPDSRGDGQTLKFTSNINNATAFNLKQSRNGVVFSTGDSYNVHVLNYANNRITWNTWGDDGGFNVYQLKYDTYNALLKKIVDEPVRFYDNNNSITDYLYQLKRNEHLIVNIGVTYNPYTEDVNHDVTFEVKNWERVVIEDGVIDFK